MILSWFTQMDKIEILVETENPILLDQEDMKQLNAALKKQFFYPVINNNKNTKQEILIKIYQNDKLKVKL